MLLEQSQPLKEENKDVLYSVLSRTSLEEYFLSKVLHWYELSCNLSVPPAKERGELLRGIRAYIEDYREFGTLPFFIKDLYQAGSVQTAEEWKRERRSKKRKGKKPRDL
ncbi:MAG: hypothetical protein WDZ90_03245 [Candidatus Paceibacterota bacterium]